MLNDSREVAAGYSDIQPPSPFYVEDWINDVGLKKSIRFIKSDSKSICAEHAGCKVELFLARADDPQRPFGIEVRIGEPKDWGTSSHVAIVPRGNNSFFIMHKDNL